MKLRKREIPPVKADEKPKPKPKAGLKRLVIESDEEVIPDEVPIQPAVEPAVIVVPAKPTLVATVDDISTLSKFLNLYNYNVTNLHVNQIAYKNLQQPLTDLNNMIGMHKLKQEVLVMALYYLKNVPQQFTEIMQCRHAATVSLAYDADEDFHEQKKSKIDDIFNAALKKEIEKTGGVASDNEPMDEDDDQNDDENEENDEENVDSFIDDDEVDWDSAEDKELRRYARQIALSLLFPPDERELPDIPDILQKKAAPLSADDAAKIALQEEEDKLVKDTIYKLDMLHTIICGSPGTGKSHVAQYIGNIYAAFGFLHPNKFLKVTMPDLIANYTGQTADKTRKLCRKAIGGVFFLDEAYSLSSNDQKGDDGYGREAADTFTDFLTAHKHDLVMIVAGYEKELESRFFSLNIGLRRRFQWKFSICDYTPVELKQIFEKMVHACGFSFSEEIPLMWFQKNHKYFPHFGGSMESLLAKVKYAHTARSILLDDTQHNKLNMIDMEKGLLKYIEHTETLKDQPPMHMYI